ncbi:hypothetical protein [Xanthobacter pseudotagetidis]|uniref:hypothetical protein n=1 Tax=Xanthobacter pseudotagetidis TaxID=3119911 RepID=UPI00372B4C21
MADKPVTAKVEPSIEDIRKDLETLKEDFTRLAETLGKTARQTAKDAAGGAEMAAGEVSDWAEEQYLQLRETIRAQPLTACAVAAGIGLVLGQVLLRR